MRRTQRKTLRARQEPTTNSIYTCVTCRDCTENKQPEAETSLVYDVLIRVIKKESASSTSVEKKKRNKDM